MTDNIRSDYVRHESLQYYKNYFILISASIEIPSIESTLLVIITKMIRERISDKYQHDLLITENHSNFM